MLAKQSNHIILVWIFVDWLASKSWFDYRTKTRKDTSAISTTLL